MVSQVTGSKNELKQHTTRHVITKVVSVILTWGGIVMQVMPFRGPLASKVFVLLCFGSFVVTAIMQ